MRWDMGQSCTPWRTEQQCTCRKADHVTFNQSSRFQPHYSNRDLFFHLGVYSALPKKVSRCILKVFSPEVNTASFGGNVKLSGPGDLALAFSRPSLPTIVVNPSGVIQKQRNKKNLLPVNLTGNIAYIHQIVRAVGICGKATSIDFHYRATCNTASIGSSPGYICVCACGMLLVYGSVHAEYGTCVLASQPLPCICHKDNSLHSVYSKSTYAEIVHLQPTRVAAEDGREAPSSSPFSFAS